MALFNGGVAMYYTRPSDNKTYCFIPVPLLGEEIEFLKTGDNSEELALIHRLTFNGTLLPTIPELSGVPTESTCISLLDRKRDQMRSALSEDRGDLLVVDVSGYPIIATKPIVVSLSFAEGTIVQQSPYTVVFEYEEPVGTGYVREYSNIWNFTQNEDDTVGVTHTVNAIGIPKLDENRSAAESAKQFVLPRLGLDKSQSAVIQTPFVNALVDVDALTGFNRTFAESIDITAGSYEVQETFILASGNFQDDRTIESSFELDDSNNLIGTVSINGTVLGRGDTTIERFNNAQAAFISFVTPQIGWAATSGILSKSKSDNRIAGTVTYSLTLGPTASGEQLVSRSIQRDIERAENGWVTQTVTTSCSVRPESPLGIDFAAAFCFENNFPIDSAEPIFLASLSGNLVSVGVQRDELAKSFTLTRTFIDQTTNLYTEEYQIERSESLDTSVVQVSINGTIQGVGVEPSTKSTARFTSASGAYQNVIEPLIYSRVSAIIPSGACVSASPIQKTLGYNVFAGTISYGQTFESRFKTANTGILKEDIEVTFVRQSQVIAEIPVPGKANGPILQDQETLTGLEKSLSITYTMAKPPNSCGSTIAPSNQMLTEALTESDILVNNTPSMHSRGEKPESARVFKVADTVNFSRTSYVFNRNVTWKYLP